MIPDGAILPIAEGKGVRRILRVWQEMRLTPFYGNYLLD
jgi:hypothetical protein